MLDKMRERLQGGRFRWLNEQMYSAPGEESFNLMQVANGFTSVLDRCAAQL